MGGLEEARVSRAHWHANVRTFRTLADAVMFVQSVPYDAQATPAKMGPYVRMVHRHMQALMEVWQS